MGIDEATIRVYKATRNALGNIISLPRVCVVKYSPLEPTARLLP